MRNAGTTGWESIIIVIALICLVLYGIVVFNKISTRDEQVTTAWTPLASALDLRYQSVPALARDIVMYTGRDDETTRDLMKDQQAYMEARTVLSKATAANEIEMDLNRIVVEAGQLYPGINSNYQFTNVVNNLQASQEKMGPALVAYNLAADGYNTYIRKFPANLFALVLGFERAAYIKQAVAGAQ